MLSKITPALASILLLAGICWADNWQACIPMPTPRGYVPAVELNGKIYVIGGDVTGGGVFSGVNEAYNPADDSWITLAPMPTPRVLHCLAAVNGKIYAIGGFTNYALNINQEYDPVNNAWTTKAPMPTARSGAGVAVVDGKIYVLGGHPGYGFLNTNQVYDPATDSWQTKAPMPTARAYLGAAAVNGRIYATGGTAGPIPGWYNTNVNEEYDPATDSWTTKTPMPTARSNLAVVEANNRVYAIGGWLGTMGSVLSLNEAYDPLRNSWAARMPMPTPRTSAGAAVGNNIFIIGGFGSGGPLAANEEYAANNPAATITLDPINPPIQIPSSGGSFDFNATLANGEITPVIFSAWIMVQLPNLTWYGPLLGPLSLFLPGSASLTRLRQQFVPGSAPAGTYTYQGYVGDYPAQFDSSSFTFVKLGAGGLSVRTPSEGLGSGEWANSGPSFDIVETGAQRAILQPEDLSVSVLPNPFNPTTVLSFELRAAGLVRLSVYDLSGRRVAELIKGWREAGSHEVTFDGAGMASGVYVVRLDAGGQQASQKMVMMK